MGKKQSGRREHLYLFFAYIIIGSILMSGCVHTYEGFLTGSDFRKAQALRKQGNFPASLNTYEQIIAAHPRMGDKVLFEMGIIYASPTNKQKDYQKAVNCFQRIIKTYPQSKYGQNSEVMINLLDAVMNSNNKLISRQKQIENLEKKLAELEKTLEKIKEIDMSLEKRKKSIP
jgi:tetratricopeptide (TPR) repeat protein